MKGFAKGFCLGICMVAAPFLTGAAMAGDAFFSNTELQIHADFERETPAGKNDIFTATVEHASEWTYGDNFFFLDIEGKPDFETDADTLYFEYAPRFSLDKMFGTKMIPVDFMGEMYATVQYNDSDKDYINRVWLSGVSFDFNFQPNYGYSNLSFLVRNEDTQDTSYQVTFVWGQPFSVAGLDLDFRGFIDYWADDDKEVFLTEPQLRLNLSSFVGHEHVLSKAAIGTEVEISNDFFGEDYGWEVNPTLFFAVSF